MEFYNVFLIRTKHFTVQNEGLRLGNTEHYQGRLLNDFDFGKQAKWFECVKEKLAAVNIRPEYIFCSKNPKHDRLVYVVIFSDPRVIWYRKGGQYLRRYRNKIILHNLQILTKEFVKWDADRVIKFFADIDKEAEEN